MLDRSAAHGQVVAVPWKRRAGLEPVAGRGGGSEGGLRPWGWTGRGHRGRPAAPGLRAQMPLVEGEKQSTVRPSPGALGSQAHRAKLGPSPGQATGLRDPLRPARAKAAFHGRV